MTARDFYILRKHSYAAKHAPRAAKAVTSRRSAKSVASATGQKFLKTARIVSEVSLERVFTQRKGI